MQGSLDRPPIILFAKRWRLKLVGQLAPSLVLFALLTAQSFEVIHKRGPVPLIMMISWFVVTIYAVTIRAWALIVPPRLEITPTHLVEREGWYKRRWTWDKIRNFRVVPWGNAPALTFDRVDSRWFGFANPDGMTTQTLSFDYELDRKSLADLLNQAHARWASGAVAPRVVSPLVLRLSSGGMTRLRFWAFTALTAGVTAIVDVSLQTFEFLGPIATALLCFVIGRARLRDIGWPQTYSVVALMVAAYAIVIGFIFSGPWVSLTESALVVVMVAPLGLFETNRALKAQASRS